MTSRPAVGIGIFVWKNGKLLMGRRIGKHGTDMWSVPGGYQEYGETFEEAAARECLEETGIHVKNLKLMTVTNNLFPDEQKHTITVFLSADWADGEVTITEPDKFVDLGWFDTAKLPSPLFVPVVELQNQAPQFFEAPLAS